MQRPIKIGHYIVIFYVNKFKFTYVKFYYLKDDLIHKEIDLI